MSVTGKTPAVLVLDVGKTHVKLMVIERDGGDVLASCHMSNGSLDPPPYLHADIDGIWAWLMPALSEFAKDFRIEAIVPSCYGSSAALIDDNGLVLPMMDYEAEPPDDIVEAYAEIAPDFGECCCPINPASQTLARQLFWQSRIFPAVFERVRWILLAPQYWGWCLTGKVASEITSLAAQTQLWNPRQDAFSSLASKEGWTDLFPPLRRAYEPLGRLSPEIAAQLGMETNPSVLVGLHDSNANFARYLAAGLDGFTLVSSGTWLITFDSRLHLEALDPKRDMVSNTDLEGRPVACTRFMGGREYAEIVGDDALNANAEPGDVERLVRQETMALPSFTNSGGPFPDTGNQGRIEGPAPTTPAERAALGSLYVALMTDVDLDLLKSKGRVVIDGSFAENTIYAGVLAALRPKQAVLVSRERNGTALGASLLWGWRERTALRPLDLEPAVPIGVEGLDHYARAWRARVEQR